MVNCFKCAIMFRKKISQNLSLSFFTALVFVALSLNHAHAKVSPLIVRNETFGFLAFQVDQTSQIYLVPPYKDLILFLEPFLKISFELLPHPSDHPLRLSQYYYEFLFFEKTKQDLQRSLDQYSNFNLNSMTGQFFLNMWLQMELLPIANQAMQALISQFDLTQKPREQILHALTSLILEKLPALNFKAVPRKSACIKAGINHGRFVVSEVPSLVISADSLSQE